MANGGNRPSDPGKGNSAENPIVISGPAPGGSGVIGSIVRAIPKAQITCLSRPGHRGLSPRTISFSDPFSDGLPESRRHE